MESATSSARGHTISLLPEPRPLPSPGFPQTPEGHSHPWEASILGPSSPFVPAVVSEQDRVPSSEQLSACPQEPSWRLAAGGPRAGVLASRGPCWAWLRWNSHCDVCPHNGRGQLTLALLQGSLPGKEPSWGPSEDAPSSCPLPAVGRVRTGA